MKTNTKMNNMNNKLNKNNKMRKFNTFYIVYRKVNVDNTNGLNVTTEDIVQGIFLNSDEFYDFLIEQIPVIKDVLWEYNTKTSFISKINYLRAKLSEINNYFPDDVIIKYDFFENDSSEAAGKVFYRELVMETNDNGSVQIDANTKAIIDKTNIISNHPKMYGIYIVPLNFNPDKINN